MPKQEILNPQATNLSEKKGESASNGRPYRPSDWVVNRVSSLPFKNDLKRIYGLDLDQQVQNPKCYGILEQIATGNHTLFPVKLTINLKEELKKRIIDSKRTEEGFNEQALSKQLDSWLPDLGNESGFYTFRVWWIPNTPKWGVERHEAKLGYKLDEKNEVIHDQTGRESLTWDKNELTEVSVIYYRGNALKKDQMDHLRLTGTLGEPIEDTTINGQKNPVILLVNEYNNEKVIPITVQFYKTQFEGKMQGKGEFYMNDEIYCINPSDGSRDVLASGGYAWVTKKSDPTEKINVWFDPRSRRFRPTIASNPHMDYSMARSNEVKQANEKAEKRAQEMSKSQSQNKGKSRG